VRTTSGEHQTASQRPLWQSLLLVYALSLDACVDRTS
jgi:hypothetical protein